MNWDFPLSDEYTDMLIRLAVAIGIGLFVGLEREFTEKEVENRKHTFAGIRTYPLFAIFGFVTGLLAGYFADYILAVALAGVIAFIIVSYRVLANKGEVGGTGEMSLVLTFLLGTLCYAGYIILSLIITVVMVLLLTFKLKIHSFVERLGFKGVRAVIQFVIISALILPFLPDINFGPYDAWNLRNIWTMVILVSGLSFAGFLMVKIMGSSKGTWLTGAAGGLASSTAVAWTFSQRSRENKKNNLATDYAIGIIVASSIMFPRILVEIYVVNRDLLSELMLPLVLLFFVGVGAAFFIYKMTKEHDGSDEVEIENPLNFSVALKFGLLYAVILLFVQFASDQFGTAGIYVASVISGITDVDAITISMSELAKNQEHRDAAATAILLAAISNTIVKFAIALFAGSLVLKKRVSVGFGAILLAGLILLLWRLFF